MPEMVEQSVWYSEPWRNRAAALALLRETEEVVGEKEFRTAPSVAAVEYRTFLKECCETDLLFLGRLLGYSRLLDRVHGPVAQAISVNKREAAAIIAKQHETDDPNVRPDDRVVRESLHLDPRGVFKSTLLIAEAVQFIICIPNIRLCVLTATKPLAKAIAGEITDHFVKGRNATLLQEMYPEWCIAAKDKREGEYTAPCRTRNWREATVMAFSIETSISGWHFDGMLADDVVDTLNSSTPAGIEKVKKNYRINHKTLMPWGYTAMKGTRYSPFDLWGDMIEKARPGRVRMLVRSALRMLDGRRLEPGEFPLEAAMELLFPELLSYAFLKAEFEDDYASFMTQYMNDAQGGHEVTFSREVMLQAVRPVGQMPIAGESFSAWRFPFGDSRYAAGAAGMLDAGRLWVVEVVRGSFTPSALAHRVVKLAKDAGTHAVTIEQTPGARHYENAIRDYGLSMGWPVQIAWLEFQEDEVARGMRIKSQEPLLVAQRLLFNEAAQALKDVLRQFCNFGMVAECEVADVISRLAERLPRSVVTEELDSEQDQAWELAKQRDMFDRTHGLGRYAPAVAVEEEVYRVPGNQNGLEEIAPGLNC